eukprot:2014692-Prymnesium_polylepis.1
MEHHPSVCLFYLDDPGKLLPSDGTTTYDCKPDPTKPFGVRVKFQPSEADITPGAAWRVNLYIDTINVGYSLILDRPSSAQDGFWRARFKSSRANQDGTLYNEFVFSVPGEGTGDCGVIECTVAKGHYKAIEHEIDDREEKPWKKRKEAGTGTGSSISNGDVCTSQGAEFRGIGFAKNDSMWVLDDRTVVHSMTVYYTSNFVLSKERPIFCIIQEAWG